VVEQLASDLKRAFPDVQGFSPRNLKYMRAFAEAWPDMTMPSTIHQWYIRPGPED
jgi:hypothetical protein